MDKPANLNTNTNSNKRLPKLTDKVRIPRNVNYYLHFLQHPEITENDIEWVLQLRHLDNTKMLERLAKIPNVPFSTADKKTITHEHPHDPSDIKLKSNATPFMHLLSHRLGAKAGNGLAEFETGLRQYKSDKDLGQLERNWHTLPHKDRHEFPEFPKPLKAQEELKKTFKLGKVKDITYTGFDGRQEFPNYTMSFKQRNCGSVKHLFAPDVSMSVGMWEEGLRDSVNTRISPKASQFQKDTSQHVQRVGKK